MVTRTMAFMTYVPSISASSPHSKDYDNSGQNILLYFQSSARGIIVSLLALMYASYNHPNLLLPEIMQADPAISVIRKLAVSSTPGDCYILFCSVVKPYYIVIITCHDLRNKHHSP